MSLMSASLLSRTEVGDGKFRLPRGRRMYRITVTRASGAPAADRPRRGEGAGGGFRVRIGRRLVLLASVGVAMTLAVVVTAFVLVSEVSDVSSRY